MLIGWVCLWACAMYNACSSAMVICCAVNDDIAREASGRAVLLYGRAPKTASLGSWDLYSLAPRGRVMGLQFMTLLILKQLHSASYRVSGMGQGSSYTSCCCC